METLNDAIVQEYWKTFLRQANLAREETREGYQAWAFGSTPDMADRLGALVLKGFKTATASLVWSYEFGDDPRPVVGGYSVILDGRGLPMCIIRTTRLYVMPFDEVDEEQAYLEGEGDRTLAYWREAHWEFFSEECANLGKQPGLNMPVLCERFERVYP